MKSASGIDEIALSIRNNVFEEEQKYKIDKDSGIISKLDEKVNLPATWPKHIYESESKSGSAPKKDAKMVAAVDQSEKKAIELYEDVPEVMESVMPAVITECALGIETMSKAESACNVCSTEKTLEYVKEAIEVEKGATLDPCMVIDAAKKQLNCDTERCVLENRKVMRMAPNHIYNELKTRFKVEGRRDVALLSNLDIDRVLEQWRANHNEGDGVGAANEEKFYHCNFSMRDWRSERDDLSKVNLAKLYAKGYRTFGCVLNTDFYSGPGKHWVALFADMRDKKRWTIEYFNSSGNPPLAEFLYWMVMQQELSQKELNWVKVFIVASARHKHQRSRSECGLYSLFYIWARLRGASITAVHEKPISDIYMLEFRHHLFHDPRHTYFPVFGKFDYGTYKERVRVNWERAGGSLYQVEGGEPKK